MGSRTKKKKGKEITNVSCNDFNSEKKVSSSKNNTQNLNPASGNNVRNMTFFFLLRKKFLCYNPGPGPDRIMLVR